MTRNKNINLDIIDDLKRRSLEACENGYLLESSLILFQTVEHLLRILIASTGRSQSVENETLLKCSESEQSFHRLIIYYELIDPSNDLTPMLNSLNRKRNNIIHRLFTNFESIENLNEELKIFVGESAEMNSLLLKKLNIDS